MAVGVLQKIMERKNKEERPISLVHWQDTYIRHFTGCGVDILVILAAFVSTKDLIAERKEREHVWWSKAEMDES